MIKKFWGQDFITIDLSEEGFNDLVFEYDTAIEFMRCAVKHKIRILGGDIVFVYGDKYIIGPDNWHSNSIDPNKSFECAMQYLQTYQTKNGKQGWFVSVVTDNLELLLKNDCLVNNY